MFSLVSENDIMSDVPPRKKDAINLKSYEGMLYNFYLDNAISALLTKNNQSSRPKKSTKLDIGDTVRVISTHKNRNGTIGKITGYRGSTQFIVTSSQEAETLADREFAVWKSNVVAVHLSTNKQAH